MRAFLILLVFTGTLTATPTANGQSLATQAATLKIKNQDTIGMKNSANRVNNVSDWHLRDQTIDFILAVADSIGNFMNDLTLNTTNNHSFTATPNYFYIMYDTTTGVVITLPTRPTNHTLVGVRYQTSYTPSTGKIAVVCPGGAKFISGNATDTIRLLGQSLLYDYRATDSTWIPIAGHLSVTSNDNRYSQTPVVAAISAASVTATYSNGTNGVGATLTSTGNLHLIVDGYSVNAGDIVIFKDQPSSFQNGVYVVTQTGTSSIAPFICTRASNYNTAYTIQHEVPAYATNGTVNGGTSWLMTGTVNVLGTDAVTYTKFGGVQSLHNVLGIGDSSNRNIYIAYNLANLVTSTLNYCNAMLGLNPLDGYKSGRLNLRDSVDTAGFYYNAINAITNFGKSELHVVSGKSNLAFGRCPSVNLVANYGTNLGQMQITGWNTGDYCYFDTAHVYMNMGGNLVTTGYTTPTAARNILWPDQGGTVMLDGGNTDTQTLSGATTQVVTHGLGYTPASVVVWPASSAAAASGGWWVSAISSTTFTISFVAAVTGSSSFKWVAKH